MVLRDMIPKDIGVTLLFDRGFRRVALARFLKQHRFHFVVRCCGDIEGTQWSGALADLPLPRGRLRDMGQVLATKDKPEKLRLVALYDHAQKDAWYLFTDLDVPAQDVVRLYARRFTIEQSAMLIGPRSMRLFSGSHPRCREVKEGCGEAEGCTTTLPQGDGRGESVTP